MPQGRSPLRPTLTHPAKLTSVRCSFSPLHVFYHFPSKNYGFSMAVFKISPFFPCPRAPALDDAPRHAARRGGERPGPGEDDQARGHVPWGT